MIAAQPQHDQIAVERAMAVCLPRDIELASVWSERERVLIAESTPQPGRWSNDYVPWIRPMLDTFLEEEDKRGAIAMKFAQACVSDIHVSLAGFLFDHMPGPTMFLCSRKDQARKFGLERVDPMIKNSRALRRVFRLGRQNNETLTFKPSAGGPLILAGAGSANEFISNPFRWIFVDEYDDIGQIPEHGDPWRVLRKRQGEYETRVRCGAFAWAHPTRPDRGIAQLYNDISDQREWTIACPHCEVPIVMQWEHVHIPDREDPESGRYECPHCTKIISDSQRWKATRHGWFESQLEPELARRRRFIGFHISKLCHPRVPIVDLVAEYLDCRTEPQLRVFYNKVMGLPYLASSYVLTEKMVRGREDHRHVDTDCPEDTFLITAGVDVQKPKDNPTLYYTVVAWTREGNAVLLAYGRVQGWGMLHRVLATFTSTRSGGDRAELRISACAIDHGYETQQVYDFCRIRHGGVICVPYKHTKGMKPDAPTRIKETVDPMRTELGAMGRIETCKVYWMDRALGRFGVDAEDGFGGSIILPPHVDSEFVNHILAPKRFESEDEHGHPSSEYIKEDGRRDDWAQCLVGAEIMAVARGLDKVVKGAPPRKPIGNREVTEGFVQAASDRRQRAPSNRYSRAGRSRRLW